jgi:hypothetical protein
MKALTLWEPWASLIAIGAKRIETRSWATSYRGPLAIHASKKVPSDISDFYEENQLPWDLTRLGFFNITDLPAGMVLATCRLVDVIPTTSPYLTEVLKTKEANYGDYEPGRFAWILTDITHLEVPVPAIGHQGLWTWDEVTP